MPAFTTPGPIAATVEVAGARVRATASDRTDTVVLVEPINEASRSDVKVASKTKVDLADGQLSVGRMTHGQVKLMNASGDIEVGISEDAAAAVDASSERGAGHDFVSSQANPDPSQDQVVAHARTRHGDIIIQRAAS
jgi:hypothetical protein